MFGAGGLQVALSGLALGGLALFDGLSWQAALVIGLGLAFSSTGLAGDAFGVVTAMFYAGYLLAVKGLRDRGESTPYLMAVTTTVTAIVLLPVALGTGEPLIPLSQVDRIVAIGSDGMMAAIQLARHGALAPYLNPGHRAIASINSWS